MANEKPTVYVIEDEEDISKLICLYLTKSEINSVPFYNAEDALKAVSELALHKDEDKTKLPDLLVLDLNLPGMSGFDFLNEFRKLYNSQIPVMIVSARDADDDIIKGLGLGADEFVTKPFSPSVLVARVKANLRRNEQNQSISKEDTICFDDYTILLNSCVLKKGSQKIPLSTKEYEVLEYIVKHAGEILSPEKIFNDVWKVQFGDITAVAVYIQRLRKKLGKMADDSEYIKTEFGKGYIFTKSCIKAQ